MNDKPLTPLGMSLTTFRQPLPPRFKPFMSEGYTYEGGLFKKHNFEYVPLYPVGAASSNANDMAKFMLAILGNGKLGTATILDSATLALMESPAHRHHPSVNPMRYGFMDVSQNGYQVIGHGGDTFWFHSLMALIPEANTGFFVSFNSEAGGGVSLQLLDQFMNQYFPEKQALRSPIAVDSLFLSSFVGEYRGNRYPHFDITKISSLFGDAKVTVEDSTRLRLTMGESVKRLVPIDSLTFREENGSKVIAFSKDERGRIAHMYLGQIPILAFDRVEGTMTLGFQSVLFMFTLICLLLALSVWPVLALSRRHYHPDNFYKQISFPAKVTAWFNYFLVIIFFVGLAMSISSPEDIVFGVGAGLKTVLTIPFIVILLTLLMAVFSVQIVSGQYKVRSKVYYLILTAGSIAFIWQLNYWNFIGYKF